MDIKYINHYEVEVPFDAPEGYFIVEQGKVQGGDIGFNTIDEKWEELPDSMIGKDAEGFFIARKGKVNSESNDA